MLINRQDAIAAKHADKYPMSEENKRELLKFAIKNSNEIFLKYAFQNDYFSEDLIDGKQ